jgi:xanthine dehydrogenase accessory factor
MLDKDGVLDRAAQLKAAGTPFVLVTVVRSLAPTSAKPGAKAIIEEDGGIQGWIGGGCAQPAVIKTARKALDDGESRLIRISPNSEAVEEVGITEFGMPCHSGGTLDIFIEPVLARPALLILGTSPVAQALCGFADAAGYTVSVAGTDASDTLFPAADSVIDDFDVGRIAATPRYVVVATQGKRDERALEAALATPAAYIAFIASARKAERLREYLKERGHDADRVDAIESPAGVAIGAVTPGEIALSVLAGVVRARRSGASAAAVAPSCCGGRQEVADDSAIDPICGMTVAIRDAEYRFDFEGTTYYFCCPGCLQRFSQAPEDCLAAAR